MLNTTFIFLSDLRLGGGHSDRDIKKHLECNKIKNYDFFHNSSKNKRGVGILIDKNLIYDITAEYRDINENILGLKILINDFSIWVVSIYGPNQNENIFFDNIQELLRTVGETPVVFGGDWNATVCTLNNADNIDTLNMQSPPSVFRSEKIQNIMTDGKLTDPFRALWPENRDYSYVPRNGRNIRSR
jgi:exonuclease III